MQKAAQIEVAAGTHRTCKGHDGILWVPVAAGNGRWRYFWLTPEQATFLKTRTEYEKYAILHSKGNGCFVCRLQRGVERESRQDRNIGTLDSNSISSKKMYVAPVIELL